MASITVTDLPTAINTQGQYDLVVSLLDVGVCAEACFGEIDNSRHLVMLFDDVAGDRPNAPTLENVQQIVMWLAKRIQVDSKILVHCHAGISRSTATAVGLYMTFGKADPDTALQLVYDQRGELMWPNPRIIALFDKYLDLHGQLEIAFKKWRKNNMHPGLIKGLQNIVD